jgi:uncharacterized tellurite resistance protein B-like protein
MFKNLFKKQSSSRLLESNKADVILRLMFEVAMSDGSLDDAELELIKKRASATDDTDEKISQTIENILQETQDSVSFYPSVKTINETHTIEEKKELLTILWNLITADSVIDAYEENLYFKIAELIKIKRSAANQIKQNNS